LQLNSATAQQLDWLLDSSTAGQLDCHTEDLTIGLLAQVRQRNGSTA
jgi:hypothetical protein